MGTFSQQHRPDSTRQKKKAVAGDAVEKSVVSPESADSSSSEYDATVI